MSGAKVFYQTAVRPIVKRIPRNGLHLDQTSSFERLYHFNQCYMLEPFDSQTLEHHHLSAVSLVAPARHCTRCHCYDRSERRTFSGSTTSTWIIGQKPTHSR